MISKYPAKRHAANSGHMRCRRIFDMPVDFRKFALLLALGCLSCYERGGGSYKDLAEARAEGAVERGWVPSFLPGSATLIREHHDVDTNEIWGTFLFDPADSPALLSQLSPIPPDETLVVRSPGSLSWWPKNLIGEIRGKRLVEEGFLVRREEASGFSFAVNVKTGEGFFWGGDR